MYEETTAAVRVSEQEMLKMILQTDVLAVVADNKEEQLKILQEWRNIFRKHDLRINLVKTKVMCITDQDVLLRVVVDGKTS